mmetsp:Transcript_17372/g.50048  ORF Transcript_17372/g.50048 Transcript_17372/m.50048 type:complete len:349 (+) Transcript_17372:406-1452(+)
MTSSINCCSARERSSALRKHCSNWASRWRACATSPGQASACSARARAWLNVAASASREALCTAATSASSASWRACCLRSASRAPSNKSECTPASRARSTAEESHSGASWLNASCRAWDANRRMRPLQTSSSKSTLVAWARSMRPLETPAAKALDKASSKAPRSPLSIAASKAREPSPPSAGGSSLACAWGSTADWAVATGPSEGSASSMAWAKPRATAAEAAAAAEALAAAQATSEEPGVEVEGGGRAAGVCRMDIVEFRAGRSKRLASVFCLETPTLPRDGCRLCTCDCPGASCVAERCGWWCTTVTGTSVDRCCCSRRKEADADTCAAAAFSCICAAWAALAAAWP